MWRGVFSFLRLALRRDIRTAYTNHDTFLHLGAFVSRLLSRLVVPVRAASTATGSAFDREAAAATEFPVELDQPLHRLQRYLVLLAIERGEHPGMVVG